MIRRSRSLSWRSYLCFLDITDGLYSSSAHPAVIVLQRRNALYAYPYFAGGIKATCECSSKWSSENGQNASTNIPYYLRSYIEGFPCVPRNFRRFILQLGKALSASDGHGAEPRIVLYAYPYADMRNQSNLRIFIKMVIGKWAKCIYEYSVLSS